LQLKVKGTQSVGFCFGKPQGKTGKGVSRQKTADYNRGPATRTASADPTFIAGPSGPAQPETTTRAPGRGADSSPTATGEEAKLRPTATQGPIRFDRWTAPNAHLDGRPAPRPPSPKLRIRPASVERVVEWFCKMDFPERERAADLHRRFPALRGFENSCTGSQASRSTFQRRAITAARLAPVKHRKRGALFTTCGVNGFFSRRGFLAFRE